MSNKNSKGIIVDEKQFMKLRKEKLTKDEFDEFREIYELQKLTTFDKELINELRLRKNTLMNKLANKYNFNNKKFKIYSDGVLEIHDKM